MFFLQICGFLPIIGPEILLFVCVCFAVVVNITLLSVKNYISIFCLSVSFFYSSLENQTEKAVTGPNVRPYRYGSPYHQCAQ
jgi:hypothetical protein